MERGGLGGGVWGRGGLTRDDVVMERGGLGGGG